jgi:hypothetical protein
MPRKSGSRSMIDGMRESLPADDPMSLPAVAPIGTGDAMGTTSGVAFGASIAGGPPLDMRLASRILSDFRMSADFRKDDEEAWQKVHENYRGTSPRPANEVAMQLRSKVTMKVTRVKVAASVAKHRDIGFKWSIEPTKVPFLWEHTEEEVKRVIATNLASMQNRELAQILEQEMAVSDMLDQALKLALDRSEKMETQIEDDLQECRFDACYDQGLLEHSLLGTMIFKGPFTKRNQIGRFARHGGAWHWVDEDGLVTNRPQAFHVSCWDFYPSPGAWCVENLEYAIDRQVLTRSGLTDLMDQPGFDNQKILNALRDNSGKWNPESWELGLMAANKQQDPTGVAERFTVLEWWGFIRVGDLRDMGGTINPVKRFNTKTLEMEEKIPDDEETVIANVWVCGNNVLKAWTADIRPKRLPFYVVPYEKIPKRLFGQGPAWMMEDWQAVLNTVYRAMLDNMAISALPMGWIDKSRVKGQSDVLHCGKMFSSEGNKDYTLPPVHFFDVPSKVPMMKQIADIAKANIQEATSIKDMVQTMAGPGGHNRTSSGLSILGGWEDASTRSVARNIDAEFTRPFITAMYFWEMQLCANDAIKGDFQVVAKGVESVLSDEALQQRISEAFLMINQDPEADIMIDKPRLYNLYFSKLGFKDAGLVRSQGDQDKRRKQKMADEQAQSDMKAESEAKFQPKMTPQDAALKFFAEVPDQALASKLAAAKMAAGVLQIQDQDLLEALDKEMNLAMEHEAAGPHEDTKLSLQSTLADKNNETKLKQTAMNNATKENIARMKPVPSSRPNSK